MIAKIIKTDAEHEEALARIDAIFDAEPGTPEGDELELLTFLVEKYEEEKFPIGLPDPIAAIKFRMEQQGLKPKDLVPYIGSRGKVSEVLNGQRPLSLTMIRNLVTKLGIPAEVLLQEPGAQLPASDLVELGQRFPLGDMIKRGWFHDFSGTVGEARKQLEDLMVSFLGPLRGKWVIPALNRQRIRGRSTADEHALLAWRIRVASEAMRRSLPEFRAGSVSDEFLSEVVKLSYLDQGPLLAREFLNKNGIHLVVEKHLPKTFLDGAAMTLPDGTRVVALTLRHDRLDNFWFTLLHELAHLALHLDGDEVDAIFDNLDESSTDAWEREADAKACEALIPTDSWKVSRLTAKYSEESVRRFADHLRIHPAIVAGRIRFEKNNYQLLGDLVGRGCVRKLFT